LSTNVVNAELPEQGDRLPVQLSERGVPLLETSNPKLLNNAKVSAGDVVSTSGAIAIASDDILRSPVVASR
jgi:hypothetical protein